PRPGRTRSYGTLGTGHGGAGHCLAPDPGRRTGARDTVGARARRDRTAAATADRAARTAAPTDRPGPVVPGTPGDAGHRPGRGGPARRGGRRGRGGLSGRAVERSAAPLRTDVGGRLAPVQLAVDRRCDPATAFLSGGLAPERLRTGYQQALADASATLVTGAVGAESDDGH